MPKFRACTPSLIDPVVMVTGTEIADRPLRVRSGNSAGSRAGRIYFCIVVKLIGLVVVNYPRVQKNNIP